MPLSQKTLVRGLWLVTIAFAVFVGVVALTNKKYKQQAVENIADEKDWDNFVAWRQTKDFVDTTNRLFTINTAAKKRGDLEEREVESLTRDLQSTQGYVRMM